MAQSKLYLYLSTTALLAGCSSFNAQDKSRCPIKILGPVGDYTATSKSTGNSLYTLTFGRPLCVMEKSETGSKQTYVKLHMNARRELHMPTTFINAPVFIAAVDSYGTILQKDIHQVNYDMKGEHVVSFDKMFPFTYTLPKDTPADEVLILVGFQLDKVPEDYNSEDQITEN